MPRLLVITLANAVDAHPGRPFSVLNGSIERYETQRFPVHLDRLSLLFALELDAGDSASADLSIEIRDVTGNKFASIELQVTRQNHSDDPTVLWQGLDLPHIEVTGPGVMTFAARVGDSGQTLKLQIVGPPAPIFATDAPGELAN